MSFQAILEFDGSIKMLYLHLLWNLKEILGRKSSILGSHKTTKVENLMFYIVRSFDTPNSAKNQNSEHIKYLKCNKISWQETFK